MDCIKLNAKKASKNKTNLTKVINVSSGHKTKTTTTTTKKTRTTTTNAVI